MSLLERFTFLSYFGLPVSNNLYIFLGICLGVMGLQILVMETNKAKTLATRTRTRASASTSGSPTSPPPKRRRPPKRRKKQTQANTYANLLAALEHSLVEALKGTFQCVYGDQLLPSDAKWLRAIKLMSDETLDASILLEMLDDIKKEGGNSTYFIDVLTRVNEMCTGAGTSDSDL